ncbi:hypothetical protein Tco_0334956 [Tanacetum coccineum]
MQSPPQYLQKGSSQPEGEHIKKDKGKKAMSSKDAKEVSIEKEVKAKAARREGEIRKEELIDLHGPEVVNKITNYDILTKKGPITLKVYKEDDTSKIIPEFNTSELNLAKLGIDLDRPLSEQDPLDRLNDLANKKRKHADDIHDVFRANKRLKSSVRYEDHPAGTVLNKPLLGLDDHARTFSSLLLIEIDKRNLNPLKQMLFVYSNRERLLGLVPEPFSLSVLRRLGSIFTSVYAAKLKRVGSLLEGLQGWKKIALCQKE